MLKKATLHPPHPRRLLHSPHAEPAGRLLARGTRHFPGFVLARSEPATYLLQYVSALCSLRPRPVQARIGVPGWAGEKAAFLNILQPRPMSAVLDIYWRSTQ